ncbi:hypothetical protein D3C80_2177720 [compost metagenome]
MIPKKDITWIRAEQIGVLSTAFSGITEKYFLPDLVILSVWAGIFAAAATDCYRA